MLDIYFYQKNSRQAPAGACCLYVFVYVEIKMNLTVTGTQWRGFYDDK